MDDRTQRRIFVVDDSAFIHEDFRKILSPGSGATRSEGAFDALEAQLFGASSDQKPPVSYDLSFALQGEEACRVIAERFAKGERYALAFVDMRMPPGWDGAQTIAKIWEIDPEVQIVICSAYSKYSWDQILAEFGVTDQLLILKKPFDNAEVAQLACALTEKWVLAQQARLQLSQLESMVQAQTLDLRVSNERLRREVAERTEIETALRASENRYALAAAGADSGLWDWDLLAGSVYYSPRWKSLCGCGDDELPADSGAWFQRVHPEDLAPLKAALAAHFEGASPHFECEYRLRHKLGHYRWMHARGLAVRNERGEPTRIAGSQSDVSDRREAEDKLRHDALHDALTGLPNRTLLSDRLRHCLLRARRDPNQRFAALFIDVDHFKRTNDTLGHVAGDKLLIQVAERLTRCVRATDLVAHEVPGEVGRLGGDEFVVLLEGLRDASDVMRVAQRLQESIAQPFEIDGKAVFLTISMGIALGSAGYENSENLLRDADTALYQAKTSGRGRHMLFEPEMHAALLSRWWLENELRNAIERNELRLVYQPILSLSGRELREFEALLRWQHPERGAISPVEFIPVAEQSGLMLPIGRWVLRAALAQLRAWEALIADLDDFSLAINVSSKQFGDSEFLSELTELLHGGFAATKRLRLEVTESALMAKELPPETLARMRSSGLKFHLDDFGTGYSSLSMLHRLPVNALKIDRSFVHGMVGDSISTSIVESTILLAHSLGAEVVAEGVETEEQAERLGALRCDMAQGYLFSRPLELAAATACLESARASRAERARAGSARPSFANRSR